MRSCNERNLSILGDSIDYRLVRHYARGVDVAMTRLEKLNRRMLSLSKDGILSDQDYNTFKMLLTMHSSVDHSFGKVAGLTCMDIKRITGSMAQLLEPA